MLGAIADDFTGATDLAAMLRRSGHSVIVVIEDSSPDAMQVASADAVVVALKIRSCPAVEAVDAALAALSRLREWGADRIYIKYASTFDSTPQGNIGHVLDAVADRLGVGRCVVVPALPENGRTVYQGHLFVHDQLLAESPMKDHPLNPMTRSRVAEVLEPQTNRPVSEIHEREVRSGAGRLRELLARRSGHVVIDAIDDGDLDIIGAAVSDEPLVSGGSGLALGLTGGSGETSPPVAWPEPGSGAVLCGSVSSATRRQIEIASKEAPVRAIDLAKAVADASVEADVLARWVAQHARPATPSDPGVRPVVCAARSLDDVVREIDGIDVATTVETVLSQVARRLVSWDAVRAILIGGGESSGAVVRELGIEVLAIGTEISPGVCWSAARTRYSGDRTVALALKSGNFGGERFFLDAWGLL
ncbi:four-carbon acid sugar kinase family protein [Brachybacterium sp. MASK1Z-5]|uniref:3-oxo-tetronate kinase n=1 Tax=Brachybacterium halotolerans TaxID=2795215 RepID=A0ABS1B7N3_9MICO|nr:3-oxo-tetronate kinase [Brachybacterium halotolerans]MBK0330600.1 four-carbon acid sugar kinase family protein [Brachybacterium halotolerans]